MSNDIYERFNSMFDLQGLKADVEAASSNVSKIELGQTGEKSKTPGMPMLKVWFDIIAGDFKGQKIFLNQILTTGFGIHKANQILKDMESGVDVVFENFDQYHNML